MRSDKELIFNIMTEIDDFKHISTRIFIAFIDFADAFGSVTHKFIFETLKQFDIPHAYCVLIENLYRYSCFKVICLEKLSKLFYVMKGTKTGCPLSAFIFIMVIDRIFKPMVNTAMIMKSIRDERLLNPTPVQGYADDVVMVTYTEQLMCKMIEAAEPIMNQSGLLVKIRKCALFYERRSGNNWYRGKGDKLPKIKVQKQVMPDIKRKEVYKYLGKDICVDGENPNEIKDIICEYKTMVDKIVNSQLPLSLKSSALNNMALAKILHHFNNTKFEENILVEVDNYVTKMVRELYRMYPTTTRDVIYLPRTKGGLGIKMFSATYRCTRVSFLIKMLNHSEMGFMNIARNSLHVDMKKRGVRQSNAESNFLGYEVDEKYQLVTNTKFGCHTNWIDLVRHCRKLKIQIKWNENKACVFKEGETFDENNLNKILYKKIVDGICEHTKTLSLQGPFLDMNHVDPKISNTIHYNWSVNDELVTFLTKARLNILPVNFIKYIWNRDNDPKCTFCNHKTESMAHVLNGCKNQFKNYYSRRHDRIVDKIYDTIKNADPNFEVFNNKCAETIIPEEREEVRMMNKRKPDIFRINRATKECEIIEVTVSYDLYFRYALDKKENDYTRLKNFMEDRGYLTRLKVLCFGSLGNVEQRCYNELQGIIKNKKVTKDLLKWCSISAIIGSNYIWRRLVKNLLT